MKRFINLFTLIVFAVSASAGVLKRAEWHVPQREYEPYDSVLVSVVDISAIQKIRVGMSLEEIKQIAGQFPVEYYIHPKYAIFVTLFEGHYYEVAFLLTKDRKVSDISFRLSPSEEKAKQKAETGSLNHG